MAPIVFPLEDPAIAAQAKIARAWKNIRGKPAVCLSDGAGHPCQRQGYRFLPVVGMSPGLVRSSGAGKIRGLGRGSGAGPGADSLLWRFGGRPVGHTGHWTVPRVRLRRPLRLDVLCPVCPTGRGSAGGAAALPAEWSLITAGSGRRQPTPRIRSGSVRRRPSAGRAGRSIPPPRGRWWRPGTGNQGRRSRRRRRDIPVPGRHRRPLPAEPTQRLPAPAPELGIRSTAPKRP